MHACKCLQDLVAAGLQLLETEALNSLEDAFDQVTAYCRQLRNQKGK